MNVVVNSQQLAAELRLLNKIVPTKPAIAILSHALFEADDQLRLYATDLEVALTTACHATVVEPGKVALPVARFLQLVEQFPDGDVTLASDKQHVTVRCGAFKSRLQALPVDDVPAVPFLEGTTSTLDGDALRQLIARTRYAINANASKYVMQGALLTLTSQGAVMVATDSKRLAIATAARTGVDQRMIVPVKAMDILASGQDDEVEVTVGPKHLFFAANGRVLASHTIDGEYPNYKRIIPNDNDKALTVDRAQLMAALRRIVLVAESNVATYFNMSDGRLELSSSSAEVGSADEVVAVAYTAAPLKACVNGRYVLDFLEAAVGVTVTLAFKDVNSAMLLTDGVDHLAVVMLMRP